ncbi:hypothetical protein PXO_05590 [Xanthomonas oryzae pv. oryzae PXO99A]|uniref:Uncharacterized protein n=1 Tax=Xanthomonas oryzae pv. oryzae (strain PXO99A) TaxID=360094 RepID=A0A0K0GKH7_XANOP|nr:hypothetical protein PXO_05590 [Xanthomonas oryzae pv. oryzae PXO99A]
MEEEIQRRRAMKSYARIGLKPNPLIGGDGLRSVSAGQALG